MTCEACGAAEAGECGSPDNPDCVEREQPQHMKAMAKANRFRLARVEVKREVADGTRRLADVILDPPESCETATIGDVLQWQHRWGRTRMRRALASLTFGGYPAPMSEAKTLGSMTARQRAAIAEVLGRPHHQETAEETRERHRRAVERGTDAR